MNLMIRSFLCAIMIVVLTPAVGFAHVLVTNASGSTGAIIHIVPDDDPVAGEQSNIFIDVQSNQPLGNPVLTISRAGVQSEVKLLQSGNMLQADYIFPVQGVYQLTITSQAGTFSYAQHVSRGIDSGNSRSRFVWAEISLVVSIVGLAVVALVAFNRRKEILANSAMH